MAMVQLNNGQTTFISALSDFKELIQEAYGNQAADALTRSHQSKEYSTDLYWDAADILTEGYDK